jgi:hypothetical protein
MRQRRVRIKSFIMTTSSTINELRCSPPALFLRLILAREEGDVLAEKVARLRLRKFGIRVSFGSPE